MGEAPLRYAVVISRPGDLKPLELSRVLAGLRRVPVQDVVPSARKCWGIVEGDLDEEAARALALRLSQAGQSAAAIPNGLIEELPAFQKAVGMSFSAQGFIPRCEGESPKEAGWEGLALIAAAGIKETVVKKTKVEEGPSLGQKALGLGLSMATGLPISLGAKKREVEKTVESAELFFYLDLIVRDPPRRLRIDAQDFDYSGLKEEKVYNVLGNFKALLCVLARRSPEAWRNRGTQMLIDAKPVREMGYESLADLERECRWLMTLQSLRP